MESDMKFIDGDIKRSAINGKPSIDFSERVNQLLVKDMALTLWSTDFDPAKPYPSMVKTWIRLFRLPGHLYNRKILWEIRELVGKVVRLDFNIDYRARDRFDRMVLFINLDKPLVSQTLINGVFQLIEYESLSAVCFSCGRYDYGKELCPNVKNVTEVEEGQPVVIERGEPDVAMESTDKEGVGSSRSRFNILADKNKERNDIVGIGEISKEQSKGLLNGNRSEAINLSKNSGLDKRVTFVSNKGPTSVIEGNSFNEDREGVTNLAPLGKTCPWFAYNSPNNIFGSRGNFMLGSVGCSNGGIFSIEGPIKMDVGVRESLLDVGKHNPVVFKENKMQSTIQWFLKKTKCLLHSILVLVTGMFLRRGFLHLQVETTVEGIQSINSMVNLISVQLAQETGKEQLGKMEDYRSQWSRIDSSFITEEMGIIRIINNLLQHTMTNTRNKSKITVTASKKQKTPGAISSSGISAEARHLFFCFSQAPWDQFFSIIEPTYMELTLEFCSIFTLQQMSPQGLLSMIHMLMIERLRRVDPPQYRLFHSDPQNEPEEFTDDVPFHHEDPPHHPPSSHHPASSATTLEDLSERFTCFEQCCFRRFNSIDTTLQQICQHIHISSAPTTHPTNASDDEDH
ncbi:hypothetical protein Gotur_019921 [Gossypium turneri]